MPILFYPRLNVDIETRLSDFSIKPASNEVSHFKPVLKSVFDSVSGTFVTKKRKIVVSRQKKGYNFFKVKEGIFS